MRWQIAVLISVVMVAAGCARSGAPAPVAVSTVPGVPALADIAAVQVNLGLPTTYDQAPRPIYPDNEQEKPIVEKLLGWLRSAEVVEGAMPTPGRQTVVVFQLRNGDSAAVRPADAGYVIFIPPGGATQLRLRAPELDYWVLAEWRKDVALGVKYCGAEDMGHGEKYDEAARTCLWAAYRAKAPARMISTVLTTEGDPISSDIYTRSDGKVTVIRDTRQDHFGEQKVTTYTCSAMERTPGDKPQFRLTGCTGGDVTEVGVW